MNKKEIRKLLKDLTKTNIITVKEYDALSEVLKSLRKSEAIEIFESEVAEMALSKSTLDNEIHYLARLLTASKFVEFDENELLTALKREAHTQEPFNILKLESFELYKVIVPAKHKGYKGTVAYHAIIGISFNDNKYTFGYNRYANSLSYTENNGPVRWFNFPKEIEHDDIVKLTVKQILDI